MSETWTRAELSEVLSGLFSPDEISDWFDPPPSEPGKGREEASGLTFTMDLLALIYLRSQRRPDLRRKVLLEVRDRGLDADEFRERVETLRGSELT